MFRRLLALLLRRVDPETPPAPVGVQTLLELHRRLGGLPPGSHVTTLW